jgi:hypothetical protein
MGPQPVGLVSFKKGKFGHRDIHTGEHHMSLKQDIGGRAEANEHQILSANHQTSEDGQGTDSPSAGPTLKTFSS